MIYMGLKSVESKVKGVGSRVKGVIRPLTTILPVAGTNVGALMAGGPRGMLDFNVQKVKEWRIPDWNTVTGYLDGPGGAAIMTGIAAGIGKWAISELGFSMPPMTMLIDAVQAGAEGAAGLELEQPESASAAARAAIVRPSVRTSQRRPAA